ncbi:acyloxyacyl hydrolase [Achromobacter xylosoxidans]|uniref:acyloxyacyl hydrolase n=1 Tax=Alcaligenes xylosoxydans xylosoxydans TaxID=85698 RepID=UPI000B2EE865|nr:acyloxyacyl hydrolase [Achromobacter xylosoxidans]
MQSTKKKMLVRLIGLALAGAATIASAQSSEGTQGGVSLHYGVGDHYQRFTLNYETPSVWTHQFGGNWGRLDLTPELGVSYWWADGDRSPSSVWQLNAIPMFRWWTGERFYLEAGIGATVFSRTRFANENISTAFQFGDPRRPGLPADAEQPHRPALFALSNASIKRPNPGLDTVQLTYTYQF